MIIVRIEDMGGENAYTTYLAYDRLGYYWTTARYDAHVFDSKEEATALARIYNANAERA